MTFYNLQIKALQIWYIVWIN